MPKNSNLFKQFLDQNNMNVNSWDDEDGETYFQFNQKLNSGPNIKILTIFNPEDTMVSIYALDYVNLVNTTRKDYMYRLLNDLNSKYTYHKFAMDNNNNIILSCFVPVENNFIPEMILKLIIGSISIMDNEYSSFMKAIWA